MDKLASLGIDLSKIVFYLVNVGLLLVLLQHFLYKPLLTFIDQRRKHIADSIEESNRLRSEFEKTLTQAKTDRETSEETLREELAKLKRFTEEERAKLITDMDAARTEMMRKAQGEIDQKKDNLLKDAEKDVKALMSKIILDIVQNKVPEKVIQESIQDSWKQYSK
ncbi:MAG: F-type H+-transporting ATPase subunit b [Oceanicoccus sp.]|jgi:F-type H+-transporting ATPase subunit b